MISLAEVSPQLLLSLCYVVDACRSVMGILAGFTKKRQVFGTQQALQVIYVLINFVSHLVDNSATFINFKTYI